MGVCTNPRLVGDTRGKIVRVGPNGDTASAMRASPR
jgi:hypothetical protein